MRKASPYPVAIIWTCSYHSSLKNTPQVGVGERVHMTEALFIPSDVRVVLSTLARDGLDFYPLQESFRPTFLPAASYVTATRVRQLRTSSSSRRCQNRRESCIGSIVASPPFTWTESSWERRAGFKMICSKEISKMAGWELHWICKLVFEQSPISPTFHVYAMSLII